MITAAYSVGPCWIVHSLFLVAWFQGGHNELRLVKVGCNRLVGGKPKAIRIQLGRGFNPKGLMDLAGG